jgi:glutamine synthetase adenylyltransferase
MSIEDQLSASQYLARLSKLSELEPSELSSAKPAELSSALSKICHDLKSYIFEDLEHAESILLQAKSDFNYLWAIAELSSSLTQPQLGRWQTQFAEVTISFALKLAWLKIAPKHKAITQSVVDANGEVAGLFIFGMGKLGGHDLNF